MNEEVKKKVLVVVSAVIICVAVVIASKTMFGGGGGSNGGGKMWFKCFNEKCNAAYSLTPDEFAKLQGDNPTMMMVGQMQAFQCQKCNQKTAYMATKCENEKCDEVFIMQMGMAPGQENQDFPDRCPKCGYSAIEQMEKEKK